MVAYIQLPQTVEYRARGRVIQLRLYSFINPLRGIDMSGKRNSGAGGATVDEKARISVTVRNELNKHEMMDSVSRTAVRAHEIIHHRQLLPGHQRMAQPHISRQAPSRCSASHGGEPRRHFW